MDPHLGSSDQKIGVDEIKVVHQFYSSVSRVVYFSDVLSNGCKELSVYSTRWLALVGRHVERKLYSLRSRNEGENGLYSIKHPERKRKIQAKFINYDKLL